MNRAESAIHALWDGPPAGPTSGPVSGFISGRDPDSASRSPSDLSEDRLAQLAACTALGLVGTYGLQGLGAQFGLAFGLPAAPELGAGLLCGLAMTALALIFARQLPRLRPLAALMVAAAAVMLLLQLVTAADAAAQAGARSARTWSTPGLWGTALWTLCTAALLRDWRLPDWTGAVLAASLSLLQATLLLAGWTMWILSWTLFGPTPAGSVLVSLPLLAIATPLSVALSATAWSRLAGHSARSGHRTADGCRAMIARNLVRLLATGGLAGLMGASLMAVRGSDWLANDLLARAYAQSSAIERHVRRSAENVLTRLSQPARLDAAAPGESLRARLEGLGSVQVWLGDAGQARSDGGPGDTVMPILATPDYRAGLLPDRGVQVELPAHGDVPAVVVQLRPEAASAFPDVVGLDPASVRQRICRATGESVLQCVDSANPNPPRSALEAGWVVQGVSSHWRRHGVAAPSRNDPAGGPALQAVAPMGVLGSAVALRLDARAVVQAIGWPLLLAMLASGSLTMLGMGWSLRRQWATLRRFERATAQAMAQTEADAAASIPRDDGDRPAAALQDLSGHRRIEDELRQSRERLRELVAHEAQGIEEERKRLAREVHDELGQLITSLLMDTTMLRNQVAGNADALLRIERMRATLGEMTGVVRDVTSNLRPPALDLGLVPAIEWLAEDFSHRWGVDCEVVLPRDSGPGLPEAAELAMFRAVQESLTNIARYARAGHVRIALEREPAAWRLTVGDDGCGFDAQAAAGRPGGGLGLLGMRERMLAIGASLVIRSDATGTCIDIRYPLGSAQAA